MLYVHCMARGIYLGVGILFISSLGQSGQALKADTTELKRCLSKLKHLAKIALRKFIRRYYSQSKAILFY